MKSVNVPPVSRAMRHVGREDGLRTSVATVDYSARMRAFRVANFCAVTFLSGALLLSASCGDSTVAPSPAPIAPVAEVASPAKPVVSPAKSTGPMHQVVLKDLDGKDVPLAQFAGRPMVIEIWATWCGPCRKNRAAFHAVHKDIPSRVALIAASADTGSDLVKNFLKTNDSSGLELMATPALYAAIKGHDPGMTIPKTVYVDSKGNVIDVAQGVQSETWIKAMSKNLR
ncbi:MAG: TlpA family protein disulfide reductase [Phycisphaerales bacterium]|nr:TlpA family protein disulfide reductase [Phycisphaerales bacterium]